ncbi:hypothetical protein AUC70_10565 [Methyloceanibacter stevinii]|uniref:Uncharacterized protein n=1 Tax=Methyloceanibacter stevinii TaxID=1774970 RepID=A0A1E3VKG6_9HYPH|nr:hypothetical protein AUC70_10565 [Methyloceanibacter stevinii]
MPSRIACYCSPPMLVLGAPNPIDIPIGGGGPRSTGPSRGSLRADSSGCRKMVPARIADGAAGTSAAVAVR